MSEKNSANPHTIKKFELIEGYVKEWVQKILNFAKCKEIVFIDCMCNNGIYEDEKGNVVEGTPIRVAKIISGVMKSENHRHQKATLYFNDKDIRKIIQLKKNLPPETDNFKIRLDSKDGNELLKSLKADLLRKDGLHYLLFYDPFTAEINWDALKPYFFGWGEVILNHMVSDTRRAITQVKKPQKVEKYEQTYLTAIESLVSLHGDKEAYDKIIEGIIKNFGNISNREYYLASFPFYLKTNLHIYSIIFFTHHKKGFERFKSVAWKTFGGRSSNQKTTDDDDSIKLNFGLVFEENETSVKSCYNVKDIADYVYRNFKGRNSVPLEEIYKLLEAHPVFPSTDYRKELKAMLKKNHHCEIKPQYINFCRGNLFETDNT